MHAADVGKLHRAYPHTLLQESVEKHLSRSKAYPVTACVCVKLHVIAWLFVLI